MIVPDVVAFASRAWPDDLAVVDGDVAWTFDELRVRVFGVAGGLLAAGLRPGDRVLDLQSNGWATVVSDLALASAGLVRVALNPRLTEADLAHIAQDAEPRAILFDDAHQDLAAVLARSIPSLELAVSTEGHGAADLSFPTLWEAADGLRPDVRPASTDLVSLNYSSGTTGRPKGCMRSFGNRAASAYDLLLSDAGRALGPGERFLHVGPMIHASGLFVLPSLASGTCQHILRRFDAADALERLTRFDVGTTVMVPTMVERLVAEAEASDSGGSPSLRVLAYAGAPMAPERIEHARAVLGDVLVQFYGMVEAIPPLTVLSGEDHAQGHLLRSAGRPVRGVTIDIVDDGGAVLEPGKTGEVRIGGAHVMAGYWGSAEGGKVVGETHLRTGDLGWMDSDGYLFLVDRRGDMIITGGYNVYPSEVEATLRTVPDVLDACVVGLPHPEWGQEVAAFVVLDGDVALDLGPVQERCADVCRAGLAGFKRPKRIDIVDALPRTPLGKVDRKALIARAAAENPGGVR